jgi:hypothetical protein
MYVSAPRSKTLKILRGGEKHHPPGFPAPLQPGIPRRNGPAGAEPGQVHAGHRPRKNHEAHSFRTAASPWPVLTRQTYGLLIGEFFSRQGNILLAGAVDGLAVLGMVVIFLEFSLIRQDIHLRAWVSMRGGGNGSPGVQRWHIIRLG